MNRTETIYQSILRKLSVLPVDDLQQVEAYLTQLGDEAHSKEENRQKIMAFAGAWQDMPQEDFDEYRREARKAGNGAFNEGVIAEKATSSAS